MAWWPERPEVIWMSWGTRAGSAAREFPRRRDTTGPVRERKSLWMLSLAREHKNPGLFGERAWGNSREQECRPDRGDLGDEPQRGVASLPSVYGRFLAKSVFRKVKKVEVGHLGDRGRFDADTAPPADEDSCGGEFLVGDLPLLVQGSATMPRDDSHLAQAR